MNTCSRRSCLGAAAAAATAAAAALSAISAITNNDEIRAVSCAE